MGSRELGNMQNLSREQENMTKIKREQRDFGSFLETIPCADFQVFLHLDLLIAECCS